MDCVWDDGKMVNLDKVDNRIAWSKVSRRPNFYEGTNRMMIMMNFGIIHVHMFKMLLFSNHLKPNL
jgi:hypothetical protein